MFQFDLEEDKESGGLCFNLVIKGIPDRKFRFKAENTKKSIAW